MIRPIQVMAGERRFLRLADRRGRRGRHQPRDRPELAVPRQSILDASEPRHDGRVLLLAPGTGGVLVVVAEDGVEHRGGSVSGLEDGRDYAMPTGTEKRSGWRGLCNDFRQDENKRKYIVDFWERFDLKSYVAKWFKKRDENNL